MLRVCRDAGAHVTVQGGRTSLVAGTVPEHDDVLLSTERLRALGDVDTVERRVQVGAGATLAGGATRRERRGPGVRRGPGRPGHGDRRRHGVDQRRRPAHGPLRQHGRASRRPGGGAARRFADAPAQPGAPRQHRLRPAGAVRRRRRHSRCHHRAGPAAAPQPVASGDGGLRVRRSGRAGRGRPDVPGRRRHRGAGIDRRPGRRADRRAPRGAAPRSRATGCCWWNWPPTTTRPNASPTCSTARELCGEPAVGVDVAAQQRLWRVREVARRGARGVRAAAEVRRVACRWRRSADSPARRSI